MTETLGVALWSTNLSFPVSSMQNWIDHVEAQIASATQQGARVFLMPEYVSEQWMHFAGKTLKPTEQIAWMARQVEKALPPLQALSKKYDMLVVAGSVPYPFPDAEPPFQNRSHIFFPDGKMLTQNKLCLTPKEKNKEGWCLSPGHTATVFSWQGWKIAVCICLDIELPALSTLLSGEEIDLILVPSMTKKTAGYHRVFTCAKARAVELQAAVGVCGAIGHHPSREKNISGASFFLPCEERLSANGILAQIAPTFVTDGAGPLLVAALPLGEIRHIRQHEAEVWPGAFSADHLKISRNGKND